MTPYKAKILPELQGQRLDKALVALFPEFSRTRIVALIQEGAVELSGSICNVIKTKVQTGQEVVMCVPEVVDTSLLPEDIPLDILFEDEHLVIINKPAGMVVHPAAGNPSGTLVNALLYHCGESLLGIGGERRPGIVHRLDKDTSGVMVAAKTANTHQALSDMFQNRAITRRYIAFCYGQPVPPVGTIKGAIGRHPKDRLRMAVLENSATAKHATTHYKLLKAYKGYSQIQCQLETGRTHQIRVHLSHKGHALVGDRVYGKRVPSNLAEPVKTFPRQALHAAVLGFTHPATKEELLFEQPLPEDMQQLA